MALRVPWELILLRPRDKARVLEESVASLPLSSKATTGGTRAPYPLIEHQVTYNSNNNLSYATVEVL
jgi:hypothetical protein